MSNRGFTLLELMVAVAILTMVMGTIFAIGIGFANAAEVQEIKITTTDEARRAFLFLTPILRQASRETINWDEIPGDSITFRAATDVSGNGFAVDENGEIELGPPITIQRDIDDAYEDGITMSQLVLITSDDVRVLANDLQQGDAPNDADDEIPDDVGFWIARRGNGLEVTIRTERQTRRGHVFTTTITEFILPRN